MLASGGHTVEKSGPGRGSSNSRSRLTSVRPTVREGRRCSPERPDVGAGRGAAAQGNRGDFPANSNSGFKARGLTALGPQVALEASGGRGPRGARAGEGWSHGARGGVWPSLLPGWEGAIGAPESGPRCELAGPGEQPGAHTACKHRVQALGRSPQHTRLGHTDKSQPKLLRQSGCFPLTFPTLHPTPHTHIVLC